MSAAEPDVETLPELYARDDALELDADATNAAWTAAHGTVTTMRDTLEQLRALVYTPTPGGRRGGGEGEKRAGDDGEGERGRRGGTPTSSGGDDAAVLRRVYDDLAVGYARHCRALETLMTQASAERANRLSFFAACIAVQARRPPSMPLIDASRTVPVDTRNPTLGAAASYVSDAAPHGHLLQVSIL